MHQWFICFEASSGKWTLKNWEQNSLCWRWSRIRKKQLSLVFKKTFRVFVSTKIWFITLLENIWIIIKTSKVIENRTEESQEKVNRKHNRKPTCVFKAKIYTFNLLFEIAHKRLAELEYKGMIQTMTSTQYIVSKVFPGHVATKSLIQTLYQGYRMQDGQL